MERLTPKCGEKYRHFKGNAYIVVCLATDVDSNDTLVIYRDMFDYNKVWSRSLAEFMSEVDSKKYPEVTQKYRFEKVCESI